MTAHKMFEELDYHKGNVLHWIMYVKQLSPNKKKFITFNLEEKVISVFRDFGDVTEAAPTTIQELKAINKQCEELGWLDDD